MLGANTTYFPGQLERFTQEQEEKMKFLDFKPIPDVISDEDPASNNSTIPINNNGTIPAANETVPVSGNGTVSNETNSEDNGGFEPENMILFLE